MKRVPIPPNTVPFLEVGPGGQITNIVSWAWRQYMIGESDSVDAGADAAAGSGDLSGASADAAVSLATALDRAPMQDLDVNAMLAVLPGLRSWSEFQAIRNTRAARAGYAAGEFPGCFYVETDSESHLVYQSDGTTWIYVGGIWTDVLANLLTGLGADDEGLQYEVDDYSHVLRWNGANWTWAPGERGSNYYGSYEDAHNTPGANAWQVCDGSTVARLNSDGTTTNVTVPNVTTPRVVKAGLNAAAIAGYSGNTPTGTNSAPTFTGAAAGAVAAETGVVTPINVVGAPYTPAGTVSAPVFTGNAMSLLEPSKQVRWYYRR